MKHPILPLLALLLPPLSAFGQAADEAPQGVMEEILIVGERTADNQLTGAAHSLSAADLAEFVYADIQQILREVPGVLLQIEDGYGLRPNISIRGVTTERSSRITLLEDNVLIAPAPYSAPSAYYFPTVGRMAGVEVVKGPAAITQGPYTIGGALNMISTPIPDSATGRLLLEAGGDSTWRLHTTYGGRQASGFGFLVETHQWRSDGFQSIDRSGGGTGLELEDYTVKLAYAPAGSRHSLQLKLQWADQESDQSYLGLTDRDFQASPYRRYGLSALDQISTAHEQLILRYRLELSGAMTFSATAYNNEHERNWYKTEGLDPDGSAGEKARRVSWFRFIQAVNRRERLKVFINEDDDVKVEVLAADATCASDAVCIAPSEIQGILDGSMDTPEGSIQLRANAREYFSRGLQLNFAWDFTVGGSRHQLEAGLRFHEDEEDRVQRNSSFQQVEGRLKLNDLGQLGNAGNRLQEASALALHLYDRIEIGAWTLAPGFRYEDIEQRSTRWEIRAGRTDDPASRAAGNVRSTRSNDTRVFLPGFGVLYSLSDTNTLVAGIHKGFTAPSNAAGVKEEEALNYEVGFRHHGDGLQAEAIFFLTDYDNLLGDCTSSSGTDCEAGDAFNGDAATVRGLEAMLSTTLQPTPALSMPLSLSYTHINGEFDTDIADTEFFGDVSEGDPLPYIPEHQLNAKLGLEIGAFSAHLQLHYVDAVCVRAACGAFEETDSSLTMDLAGHYVISESATVYARLENLAGQEDLLGRHPYGARPGKGRTAILGLRVDF